MLGELLDNNLFRVELVRTEEPPPRQLWRDVLEVCLHGDKKYLACKVRVGKGKHRSCVLGWLDDRTPIHDGRLHIHRLVVALDGEWFELHGDKEVHHENGKYDNRRKYLRPVKREEHEQLHADDPREKVPVPTPAQLADLYVIVTNKREKAAIEKIKRGVIKAQKANARASSRSKRTPRERPKMRGAGREGRNTRKTVGGRAKTTPTPSARALSSKGWRDEAACLGALILRVVQDHEGPTRTSAILAACSAKKYAERTAQRCIRRLLDAGLIEYAFKGRTGFYQLATVAAGARE